MANVKKKCKVVMLPTEKAPLKGQIYLSDANLYISHNDKRDIFINKAQHLYITSDSEIKEGDWYYNPAGNTFTPDMRIVKCESSHEAIACRNAPVCSKIIACTDSSLHEIPNSVPGFDFSDRLGLPQPSPQFIEKYIEAYNAGEKIEFVNVEYESY